MMYYILNKWKKIDKMKKNVNLNISYKKSLIHGNQSPLNA